MTREVLAVVLGREINLKLGSEGPKITSLRRALTRNDRPKRPGQMRGEPLDLSGVIDAEERQYRRFGGGGSVRKQGSSSSGGGRRREKPASLTSRYNVAVAGGPSAARPIAAPTPSIKQPAAAADDDEFDLGKLASRLLAGWLELISQLLQPHEHAAATSIASQYRTHAASLTYSRQRTAATSMQACARRQLARESVSTRRGRHAAAIILQKWVRGFVDRQWATMVGEETLRLREAAKASEAESRYEQKTSKRHRTAPHARAHTHAVHTRASLSADRLACSLCVCAQTGETR